MIFSDCSTARWIVFWIKHLPQPLGLFISQRRPIIIISGVRTPTSSLRGISSMSNPQLSRKATVRYSCFSRVTPLSVRVPGRILRNRLNIISVLYYFWLQSQAEKRFYRDCLFYQCLLSNYTAAKANFAVIEYGRLSGGRLLDRLWEDQCIISEFGIKEWRAVTQTHFEIPLRQ